MYSIVHRGNCVAIVYLPWYDENHALITGVVISWLNPTPTVMKEIHETRRIISDYLGYTNFSMEFKDSLSGTSVCPTCGKLLKRKILECTCND